MNSDPFKHICLWFLVAQKVFFSEDFCNGQKGQPHLYLSRPSAVWHQNLTARMDFRQNILQLDFADTEIFGILLLELPYLLFVPLLGHIGRSQGPQESLTSCIQYVVQICDYVLLCKTIMFDRIRAALHFPRFAQQTFTSFNFSTQNCQS